MYMQVGHLLFLFLLKTSMLTESGILKISALGFLAKSFLLLYSFYSALNCHLYCIPVKCMFSTMARKVVGGVTSVVDYVKCVPIPVIRNRMTYPLMLLITQCFLEVRQELKEPVGSMLC